MSASIRSLLRCRCRLVDGLYSYDQNLELQCGIAGVLLRDTSVKSTTSVA